METNMKCHSCGADWSYKGRKATPCPKCGSIATDTRKEYHRPRRKKKAPAKTQQYHFGWKADEGSEIVAACDDSNHPPDFLLKVPTNEQEFDAIVALEHSNKLCKFCTRLFRAYLTGRSMGFEAGSASGFHSAVEQMMAKLAPQQAAPPNGSKMAH